MANRKINEDDVIALIQLKIDAIQEKLNSFWFVSGSPAEFDARSKVEVMKNILSQLHIIETAKD